jgi:protein subunit release factor B
VVKKDKREQLEERLEALGVQPADLVERFIRGSGHGGQKINKTSSCVHLRHSGSGIEVKCQQTRSREENRLIAREELCRALEGLAHRLAFEKKQAMEKARRRRRPRPRKVKERILDSKRRRSYLKKLRNKPNKDD